MGKWIERLVIAAALVILGVTCVGMYATWRDCSAIGGTAVRGMVGLVCIK